MPVLVETLTVPFSQSAQDELQRVYTDSPAFDAPEEAITALSAAVANGDTLYVGVFNARFVAAVLVGNGSDARQMRFLNVHPATRGRGVAERLVAEVRRLETERGSTWLEAAFDLSQEGISDMLLSMGFVTRNEGLPRILLASPPND